MKALASTDTARAVVVAGPEAGPEGGVGLPELVRPVAARGGELVVLSVGWPPTPGQRRLVDEAMAAAAELGFACTARLVREVGRVRDHLRPDDDVLDVGPVAIA